MSIVMLRVQNRDTRNTIPREEMVKEAERPFGLR